MSCCTSLPEAENPFKGISRLLEFSEQVELRLAVAGNEQEPVKPRTWLLAEKVIVTYGRRFTANGVNICHHEIQ